MTLRRKLFSITVVVVAVLTTLCVLASRHFLLKNAVRLERQYVVGALDRVRIVLASELAALDRSAVDWAAWDDSYRFVEDNDDAYRESNLPDIVTKDLALNLLAIVHSSGRLLFIRMVDDTYTNAVAADRFAATWLKPGGALLSGSDPQWRAGGLMVVEGVPMIVVSRPVLTSRNEGPGRGWVVMGRRLGPEQLQRLAHQSGAAFSLMQVGMVSRYPMAGGMVERLMGSDEPEIHDSSADKIYGFRCIKDVGGKPGFVLTVEYPRDLYQQARTNVSFIALWFLLVGVALLSFTLWILERYILIPLSENLNRVRDGVADVTAARSLSRRLSGGAGDEFRELASAINRMLEELEAAQRAANENREQLIRVDKLVALGTLVSGIAHEINNPNTVIGSNALVLQELFDSIGPVLDSWAQTHADFRLARRPYAEVGPEIPALLKEMHEASERIAEMIRELKQFSSPSDVALSYPVSLNDSVRSAMTLLRAQVSKCTECFQLQLDESIPPIRANPARLEQVVVNLTHNALVSLQDPSRGVAVSTGYSAGDSAVCLVVRDEGCGIPPEHLLRLTDPFFTTRRESGGTGLGLYVVANIVKEHGGKLSFDSTPGRGTVATVWFPVEKGDAA